MARPLRIELAGGVYHVTSRGDRREMIYGDDADRRACALGSGLSFAHPCQEVLDKLVVKKAHWHNPGSSPAGRASWRVWTLGSGLSFAHERSVDACGVFLKRRGLSESSVATTSSAASEGTPRARPLPRRSSGAGLHASQASARLRHQEGLSFAHPALIDA